MDRRGLSQEDRDTLEHPYCTRLSKKTINAIYEKASQAIIDGEAKTGSTLWDIAWHAELIKDTNAEMAQ